MKKHNSKLLCVIFSIIVFSLQTSKPLLAADCSEEIKQIKTAISKGEKEEAMRLITSATDINCKRKPPSVAPLIDAVLHQQEQIVKLLIKKGADVNFQIKESLMTPLHYSALSFNRNISKMLIDAGADVNAKERLFDLTPIFMAFCDRTLILNLFLPADFTIDYNEVGYPIDTYTRDYFGTIELLVKSGAKLGKLENYNASPLSGAIGNAAKFDEVEVKKVVRLLIANGSKYNDCKNGNYYGPIYSAIQERTTELLKLLVENDSDIISNNCYSLTGALQFAIEENSVDLVKTLMKNKTTVNSKDDFGRTPLHIAALTDNAYIAKLLLKAGAKTIIKDMDGLNPLQLAKKKKSKKVVELLAAIGK